MKKVEFLNVRSITIAFSILVVVLVIFLVGSSGKVKAILQENKNLSSNIEALKAEITTLGEKLQKAVTEANGQRSELEETRNKLTQERLKNTQLKQQIEELEAKLSSLSSGSPPSEEISPASP